MLTFILAGAALLLTLTLVGLLIGPADHETGSPAEDRSRRARLRGRAHLRRRPSSTRVERSLNAVQSAHAAELSRSERSPQRDA